MLYSDIFDVKKFLPEKLFRLILSSKENSSLISKNDVGVSDERFVFYLQNCSLKETIITLIKERLEEHFGEKIKLSTIQTPTLRVLPKGHKGIHIHTDFSEKDKHEEIIAILYCNTTESGFLEFWSDNGEFYESYKKIKPTKNRLVAFRSTYESIHSVSTVHENRITLNFTFSIL